MFLSSSQIENSLGWLVRNGSPPVTYLTHRDLLKTPSDSAAMIKAWNDVYTCQDAQEIFSAQRDDGSWCSGGAWALKPSYVQKSKPGGYDPESPKYVTTIWVLPLLGDMGFTAEDGRIKKACEYVLSYTAKGMEVGSRIFNDPAFYPDREAFGPCRFSQYLVAFGKVGFHDDVRVKKGYRDGMDSRVAKYRLYHLIADDWLTYYATRIGVNMQSVPMCR